VNLRALVKIIGASGLVAGAAFLISFLISCVAVAYEAGRRYPYDGQNGLAGFLVGSWIGLFTAIPTFLGTLIWRIIRFDSSDES
jgi:uncharacterized protein YqgC (DUF456 family)